MNEFALHEGSLANVPLLQEQVRQTRAGLVAEIERNSQVFGCYLVFDRQGGIRYMNLEGLDSFHLDTLRQQGWHLTFADPKDADVFRKCLDRAFAGGNQEHCEIRLQGNDGRIKWIRWNARPGGTGNNVMPFFRISRPDGAKKPVWPPMK